MHLLRDGTEKEHKRSNGLILKFDVIFNVLINIAMMTIDLQIFHFKLTTAEDQGEVM